MTAEVERTVGHALRVPFRLCQDGLRSEGYLVGFDDAQVLAGHEEGVVGGAIGGRVLGYGVVGPVSRTVGRVEGHNLPPRALEKGVNARRRVSRSDSDAGVVA